MIPERDATEPFEVVPTPAQTKQPGSVDSEYVFVFQVKRTEADIEGAFLTKSGSLGSAAARAETDFALTHSKDATSKLVTETLDTVRLPISQKLLDMVPPDVKELVRKQATEKAGPILVLPARARLNMTASRVAASINGTLVGTMSGQGSALLQDLFSDLMPLDQLISNKYLNPGDIEALSERINKKPDATKAALKVEEIAEEFKDIADAMSLNIKARVPVPFETVPIKYSNWGTHQAVMAVYKPQVLCVTNDGEDTRETVMSVVWYDDPVQTKAILQVEPIMQGIYNTAWSLTEKLVFKPVKNLTKSIMRVPVGYNGSGYAPAAAVNDTPPSFSDSTLEAVLSACLLTELSNADFNRCLEDLKSPSVEGTLRWAGCIASAMSAFSAYTMPYRVDGTPVVLPTGVKMVQSESWRAEAIRSIMHSDDCDGSACSAISIIRRAEEMMMDDSGVNMDDFPALRALANSIGAHYVYGTTVLAANAGHADAANEHTQQLAGHAIALALPKAAFLKALERGSRSNIGGQPVTKHGETRAAVTAARFEALYPESLRRRMVTKDQPIFKNFAKMMQSDIVHAERGLQPLSMEGTSYASSCMYTHSEAERVKRQAWYAMDKKVATSLSPNITRTHKALDVGEKSEHAFYMSMVEIGFSMQHPLFKNATLRKHYQASAQYRFARPRDDGPLEFAGANPAQLALHDYAVVPLWEVDTKLGKTLDEAHTEAAANVLPMRHKPYQMNQHEVENLAKSEAILRDLQSHLKKNEASVSATVHETLHILSFASIAQNPNAIQAFAETIKEVGDIGGEVYGLGEEDILRGVAQHAGDDEGQREKELGRMVTLSLFVPM